MAKPRILAVIHYLEIGGAETSLIGLLNALDYSRVDVDLFVYSHRGELMGLIPEEVNLLPEVPEYAQIERPLQEVLKDGYERIASARIFAKVKTMLHDRKYRGQDSGAGFQFVADAVTPLLPPVNPGVEYDLALSFVTPHNIVRDKVRARRKLAWIHTDYSRVHVNAAAELPVWAAFDRIIAVSGSVASAFAAVFPSLSGKLEVMENILSPLFVRSMADSADVSDEMPPGPVRLLSVGRFSSAKNYDNVPDICRRMVKAGVKDLRWYIIGYGGDEALIRRRIAMARIEEHVIILGKRSNPYPYIKACDIYVQPSRYEGKSVTVREAQMLCKPLAITAYPTARDQVHDGLDGVIVPLDNEGCANALAAMIADLPLRSRLEEYLAAHDYGNEAGVARLYELM